MKNKRLKVIQESETGLNTRFLDTSTRRELTLNQAIRAVENGKYPGYHVVNRNGTRFIRSNPDGNERNNLE